MEVSSCMTTERLTLGEESFWNILLQNRVVWESFRTFSELLRGETGQLPILNTLTIAEECSKNSHCAKLTLTVDRQISKIA